MVMKFNATQKVKYTVKQKNNIFKTRTNCIFVLFCYNNSPEEGDFMDYEMLVNKQNPLTKDYEPEELYEIHEPMSEKLDKSYINRLNLVALIGFKLMQHEALKEGYEFYIDSSYRTYEYQERIFNQNALDNGIEHAKSFVALPGTSEHQTGLAIDIVISKAKELQETFDDESPEAIWLFNNAHRFGYILRYPKGKSDITGYSYEPWHFRFVGTELATELYNKQITLEEYYNLKQSQNPPMKLELRRDM